MILNRRSIKTLLVLSVILSMISLFLYPMSANNLDMIEEDYEKIISSFIYTFDEVEETVKFDKYLYDIDNKESFALLIIGEQGYGVVAKNSDMILEVRYESDIQNIKENDFYIGGGCFINKAELSTFIKDTNKKNIVDDARKRNKHIKNEKERKFKYKNENISRAAVGSVVKTKPSQLTGGKEIGVADSRMTMYQKMVWRNNSQYSKNGVCGSIAAATMVTYHDMYISASYIKQPYSCTSDAHAKWIINYFKKHCEILSNGGSTPTSVTNGITRAIYNLNNKSSIVAYKTSSESTVKSKVKAGRPVVLELPGIKQNPYGAHMVCAYKYVDYNGYLWYKASDNWGNLAWINRNWVGQAIYLN